MASPPPLDDRIPPYAWVSYGLWLVCTLVGFVVVFTVGILLPSITEEFGLSPSQQGLLGSAAFWGNLVLTIPLSWWLSKYSPKLVTGIGVALGVVLLLLHGWALAFGILIAARLAFGIVLLGIEPPGAILIQQWFPPRKIVIANSFSNAVFGFVMAGGLVFVPLVLKVLGDDWRVVFYMFAAIYAALLVLWVVLGKERPIAGRKTGQAPPETGLIKGTLKHRDLWIAGFGFIGATVAWSSFLAFFPTLLLDTYDISLQWSGSILATGIFVGGFAGLGVGYLAVNAGHRNAMLQILGALTAGSYVGMALTDSIPLLFGLAVLNGVGWGFFPLIYTVPFQLPGVRPREIAIGVGFMLTAVSAGTLLGPLMTGYLQETFADLSLALMVIGFAPLTLVAAGMFIRFGLQDPAPAEATG